MFILRDDGKVALNLQNDRKYFHLSWCGRRMKFERNEESETVGYVKVQVENLTPLDYNKVNNQLGEEK